MRILVALIAVFMVSVAVGQMPTTVRKPAAHGEVDLEAYGNPAVISWSAAQASFEETSGKNVIILSEVSSLATITTNLHKHHQRLFSAFPIAELAEAWNTCNDMKHAEGLFHEDGINAVITFDEATGLTTETEHLSTAPLITSSKKAEPTVGSAEGMMTLMLDDATFSQGVLSFEIKGATSAMVGEISNVNISTECLAGGILP